MYKRLARCSSFPKVSYFPHSLQEKNCSIFNYAQTSIKESTFSSLKETGASLRVRTLITHFVVPDIPSDIGTDEFKIWCETLQMTLGWVLCFSFPVFRNLSQQLEPVRALSGFSQLLQQVWMYPIWLHEPLHGQKSIYRYIVLEYAAYSLQILIQLVNTLISIKAALQHQERKEWRCFKLIPLLELRISWEHYYMAFARTPGIC